MAAKAREKLRWWEPRVQRSNVVVAAVVGALVGSVITGGVSYLIHKEAVQAQRSDETRQKRDEVYNTFLEKARKWKLTITSEIDCKQHGIASACGRPVDDDLDAVRKAFYDIRIYGSVAASDSAYEVVMTLPFVVPSIDNPVDATKATIDEQQFENAYSAFQLLMCRELPAEPRPDC